MPPKKQPCRCSHRRRPPVRYSPSGDDLDYDDDDDVDLDELAELRAKEARRRAQRRASKARYRARHPERVAAYRKSYRARYPEKVAAEKRRYRQKYRAKYLEAQRRYYYTHVEQRRDYDRERQRSEHRRAWRAQHRLKKREAAALARKRERWRTVEKIKALGPLKLTIALEDCFKSVNTPVETYLETFCQSLEVDDRPKPSFCELLDDSYTLTDLDSGEHRPLDRPVWDQWLDDLLDDLSKDNISDLSSDEVSMKNINDLSSDDLSSLCDLLPDEWAQPKEEDSSFDLDDDVVS